jgi:formate-dependent nitrite reductase membrane component NrfD
MNGRKLPILFLLMTLACAIPLFTLLVVVSSGQREAAIYGSFFMEFITPTLLLGLALTIHFIHKAQAA